MQALKFPVRSKVTSHSEMDSQRAVCFTPQTKQNNTYSCSEYIDSVEILGFLILLFLPWITQSIIKKNTVSCTGQAACYELTQAFSFLFWVPLWASQIQIFSLASKLGLFLPDTTSHSEKPSLSKRAEWAQQGSACRTSLGAKNK